MKGKSNLRANTFLKRTNFSFCNQPERDSLVAQLVKNPPAMQETSVQSLGWEDPLEKGMATDSSILVGRKESDMTE